MQHKSHGFIQLPYPELPTFPHKSLSYALQKICNESHFVSVCPKPDRVYFTWTMVRWTDLMRTAFVGLEEVGDGGTRARETSKISSHLVPHLLSHTHAQTSYIITVDWLSLVQLWQHCQLEEWDFNEHVHTDWTFVCKHTGHSPFSEKTYSNCLLNH